MEPIDTIESTLIAMEQFGGSFIKKLAELYRVADDQNRKILRVAFVNHFVKYQEFARRREALRR